MHTITKTYEFDAGHRLSKGYVGKCAHFHGHRYKVEVCLETETLNNFDMVFDFTDLTFVKEWLDETFDHKMVLWKGDPLAPPENQREELGIFFVDENPTAEYFAQYIHSYLVKELHHRNPETFGLWKGEYFYLDWGGRGGGSGSDMKVKYVQVWETPKCWARYAPKTEEA